MKRILLIDDDDGMRSVLTRTLKRAGYEVIPSANGHDGLERATDGSQIDLVITDLIMPGVEGVEVILNLKQLHPELRVIAISGGGRNSPARYLDIASMVGADATLAKPFSNDELLGVVRSILEDQPAPSPDTAGD